MWIDYKTHKHLLMILSSILTVSSQGMCNMCGGVVRRNNHLYSERRVEVWWHNITMRCMIHECSLGQSEEITNMSNHVKIWNRLSSRLCFFTSSIRLVTCPHFPWFSSFSPSLDTDPSSFLPFVCTPRISCFKSSNLPSSLLKPTHVPSIC